jgi:succinoglycan biosynthesis protein ExoM
MEPDSQTGSGLSVCIATYRREPRLRALLADLERQTRRPEQVVVVDNDASGSARATVDAFRASTAFELVYEVQPQKNISLTRNRTVALARGQWLAFVDDDERAPAQWLEQLMDAAERYSADGVQAPVEPVLPDDAPPWLRRGRFYDWARFASGTVVPGNRLRFGNVLLRGSLLRQLPGPFDPVFGLTGGEDGDLLSRLVRGGARIVWCDEAAVQEPVESARLSARWLLRRSLRGGQDYARHWLAGHYGPPTLAGRAAFFLRALLQLMVAAVLSLLLLPLGLHHTVRWLIKVTANFGKLSVLWGWHYNEYA